MYKDSEYAHIAGRSAVAISDHLSDDRFNMIMQAPISISSRIEERT
jgi:hypothetical protein